MKYRIMAPAQKRWNASDGQWEPIPTYNSSRPIWGIQIKDGEGETEDRQTAIEFADMGYRVEPNPKDQRSPSGNSASDDAVVQGGDRGNDEERIADLEKELADLRVPAAATQLQVRAKTRRR